MAEVGLLYVYGAERSHAKRIAGRCAGWDSRMQRAKVRFETPIAFVLGLIAGSGAVGFFTMRQIQYEHRQATMMAYAAQQAQSGRQAEIIRAHEMVSSAMQDARRSQERAKRAEQMAHRQAQTNSSEHPPSKPHE